MDLRIRDSDVPCIVQGSRSVRVLLRLDDLIEYTVNIGRGNVSGVASVVSEGGDEGGIVVLLRDGGSAARSDESGTESLSLDGAVVVRADTDLVADFASGGRPVLEGPLAIKRPS